MGGLLRPWRRWVCACYVTSRAWRCLQRRLPGNRARLVEAAAGPGRAGAPAVAEEASPSPAGAWAGPAGRGEEPAPQGGDGWERGRSPPRLRGGRASGRAESPGPGTGPPGAGAAALVSASESRGSAAPAEFVALETRRGFCVRCHRFGFIWHRQGRLHLCVTSLCGVLCGKITPWR